MKQKVLMTVILGVITLGLLTPAFAQKIYRPVEPPGRTAATYIAGILGLAGGVVSWDVKRVGDIFKYRITEVGNIDVDIDFLNNLIDRVDKNVELRSDEKIRNFIEEKLYDKYSDIKEKVKRKIGDLTKPGTELRNAIEALLGHPINPDDKRDVGFLNAYINKLKKGIPWFDIADEINLFKLPLKDVVSSFIKEYSGETFDITNELHSGVLSFFSEWANSLDLLGRTESSDEAVGLVSAYVETMKNLKDSIQQNIYKGADINIFSFLENGIISYFADQTLTGSSLDEVRAKIEEFGARIEDIKSDPEFSEIITALQSYAGEKYNEALLSRFVAMTIGKSLSDIGEDILNDWAKHVTKKEAEEAGYTSRDKFIDAVFFNPSEIARKIEIVSKGEANITADDVFDLERDVINDDPDLRQKSLKDWMVRLIQDMKYVKDIANARAKELGLGADYIKISDLAHEASLIGFASRIANLVDIDKKGHEEARNIIAKEISKLEKEDFLATFPPVEQTAQADIFIPVASDEITLPENVDLGAPASTSSEPEVNFIW